MQEEVVWLMDSELCYDCGDVLNALETSGQCWRCAEAESEIDYEPYYSRADEMADMALADYYDEVARNQ